MYLEPMIVFFSYLQAHLGIWPSVGDISVTYGVLATIIISYYIFYVFFPVNDIGSFG